MAKRSCKCLNIVLNIKESESEEVNGAGLLGAEENDIDENVDAFFSGQLLLVKLAFAGVEVQQKLVVKERSVGDYKVYKCINCDLSTHAVHKFKGLERVVASKDLLGEASYDKMRQSEKFSAAFKIILNNSDQDVSNKSESVNGTKAQLFQSSLSDANSKVNDIVKRYLAYEEQAMNEKIRIFAEQQKEIFQKIEEKADRDKDKFLRIINKKEEHALQFSISDAMKDARFTENDSIDSDTEEPSPDLPQIRGRKVRPQRSIPIVASSLPTNRMPSRVLSQQISSSVDENQRSKTKRRHKSRSEDDTMFDLDGFNESRNCEPFFESDEDSSGDSSSLGNSGGYYTSSRGSAGDRIYATSVPVTVPMFRGSEHGSYEERSYDESEQAPSPERMAESIKALARSLHDSTSIFGDLPGPRYNTMPYH